MIRFIDVICPPEAMTDAEWSEYANAMRLRFGLICIRVSQRVAA